MKNLFLLITLLSISILSFSQDSNILLKTDFDGKVTQGSLDELIQAIQNGAAIRVGWHLDFDGDKNSDLEHWIDADFLTILEGHVFNQIEPIYQQAPKSKIPQVKIMPSPTTWTGIIGTNGILLSRYIMDGINLDDIPDETMREKMQQKLLVKEQKVATVWAVKK